MKESSRKLLMWCSLAVGLLVTILAVVFGLTNKDIHTLPEVKLGWAYDIAAGALAMFMVLSLAAILVWAVISIIKKPKGFLIALGCVIVVLGAAVLCTLVLDKPMDITLLNKYGNTVFESKLIAVACYTTYFIGAAAVVMLIYSEIAKMFKK